jgi:prepilin-type N-terminal cleavage/methylation domain-containing protein
MKTSHSRPCSISFVQTGFTLVELIVVITILAILGTLGFISLQNYAVNARDTKRISDLQILSKGMESRIAQGALLPEPDEQKLTLTLSGILIQTQWVVGKNTITVLNTSSPITDPKTSQAYTYTTTASKQNYQIYWELEWDMLTTSLPQSFHSLLIPEVYANGDTTSLYMYKSTRLCRKFTFVKIHKTLSIINKQVLVPRVFLASV